MNEEVKKEWTAALRSGEFKQGENYLHPNSPSLMFCCLGVLCELHRRKFNQHDSWKSTVPGNALSYLGNVHHLPVDVVDWAGLRDKDPVTSIIITTEKLEKIPARLSTLNDSGNWDFNKIADLVEKEL